MRTYNAEVMRLRMELCRKFIATGEIDRGISEELMAYCERRKRGKDLPAMPSPRSYVPVMKRSGDAAHQPDVLPPSRPTLTRRPQGQGSAPRRRQSNFRDLVVQQLLARKPDSTERDRRRLGQLQRAVNEAKDSEVIKAARWNVRSAAQQRRRARERAETAAMFEKQEALYHEFLVGACVRSA